MSHRLQLPAMGLAGGNRMKEEEAYHRHEADVAAAAAALTHTNSTSPSSNHPAGPPPPYSLPAPPILLPAAGHPPERTSPPVDSRRPSGEKDVIAQSMKQSLPSISEALGVDNQGTYQTSLAAQAPPPPPPIPSLQAPSHRSVIPQSPVPAMRLYAADPPQSHSDAYAQHGNYAPNYQSEASRTLFSGAKPALQLSTAQPNSPYHNNTAPTSYPQPPSSSPVYERGNQTSAPSSFTYGYTPFPSRYQPSSASNVIYQPSTHNGPPAAWKPDRSHRDEKSFGESVKRHLDMYDLEASLNDVSILNSCRLPL